MSPGRTVGYGAPGRINLIGEHTDYNLGLALPIALPQRTVATLTPDHTDTLRVSSASEPGEVAFPLDGERAAVPGWGGYVAGVLWALRQSGYRVVGGRMSITSDVAMGAGLSSSAALECAVLGAITTATGQRIDRIELARIAQRAENDYVGAPTGLMDQLASLFGAPRRALLMDFRGVSVREVPFDPDAAGVTLLVINSQARHRHAGGDYAARRRSCERAAGALGVGSLRDVQDRELSVLDLVRDPEDARRARHVLTENRRVLEFVSALEGFDLAAAGGILNASHASMRDDFAITTEHIDLIAETAVAAGALGARMTGGGFGGCVIALVPVRAVAAVAGGVLVATRGAGYNEPTIMHVTAAAGAGAVRDSSG
jgi:galactokinase